MARPRKRRRRRGRGGGRFLSLYLVLAVVVIAVVIVSGCIVFFKVNQFEVEGNQRYSTEEIANASGVNIGDNLFLVNKTETARKLLDELAYVRSVNIKRKLPDTLVITVAETDAAAAIQSGKEWWLVNEEGKVLDTTKKPKEFIQVTGLELVSPEAGQSMSVKSEGQSPPAAQGHEGPGTAGRCAQRGLHGQQVAGDGLPGAADGEDTGRCRL